MFCVNHGWLLTPILVFSHVIHEISWNYVLFCFNYSNYRFSTDSSHWSSLWRPSKSSNSQRSIGRIRLRSWSRRQIQGRNISCQKKNPALFAKNGVMFSKIYLFDSVCMCFWLFLWKIGSEKWFWYVLMVLKHPNFSLQCFAIGKVWVCGLKFVVVQELKRLEREADLDNRSSVKCSEWLADLQILENDGFSKIPNPASQRFQIRLWFVSVLDDSKPSQLFSARASTSSMKCQETKGI